jgi:FO synthase subunit 2
MTGTDAEILNDKLRKKICPDKIRSAEWIDIIKAAHKSGVKTTATILFGHIEDEIHLGEHLEIIRNIQRETSGFTEFIPIPFSMHKTQFSELSKLVPTRRREALLVARDDDNYERNAALRLLSISRIFFRDTLPNIQSGWFRLGLDTALEGLSAGANDLGETVFDDSAIKTLRPRTPSAITPEKIKKSIIKVGKTPRHRTL